MKKATRTMLMSVILASTLMTIPIKAKADEVSDLELKHKFTKKINARSNFGIDLNPGFVYKITATGTRGGFGGKGGDGGGARRSASEYYEGEYGTSGYSAVREVEVTNMTEKLRIDYYTGSNGEVGNTGEKGLRPYQVPDTSVGFAKGAEGKSGYTYTLKTPYFSATETIPSSYRGGNAPENQRYNSSPGGNGSGGTASSSSVLFFEEMGDKRAGIVIPGADGGVGGRGGDGQNSSSSASDRIIASYSTSQGRSVPTTITTEMLPLPVNTKTRKYKVTDLPTTKDGATLTVTKTEIDSAIIGDFENSQALELVKTLTKDFNEYKNSMAKELQKVDEKIVESNTTSPSITVIDGMEFKEPLMNSNAKVSKNAGYQILVENDITYIKGKFNLGNDRLQVERLEIGGIELIFKILPKPTTDKTIKVTF